MVAACSGETESLDLETNGPTELPIAELPSFTPGATILDVDEESLRMLLRTDERELTELDLRTGRTTVLSNDLSLYRYLPEDELSFPLETRYSASGFALFMEGPDVERDDLFCCVREERDRVPLELVVARDGLEALRVASPVRGQTGGRETGYVTYAFDSSTPSRALLRDELSVRLVDLEEARVLDELVLSSPFSGAFVQGESLVEDTTDSGLRLAFGLPVFFNRSPRFEGWTWLSEEAVRMFGWGDDELRGISSERALCRFEADRIVHFATGSGETSSRVVPEGRWSTAVAQGPWCVGARQTDGGQLLLSFDGDELKSQRPTLAGGASTTVHSFVGKPGGLFEVVLLDGQGARVDGAQAALVDGSMVPFPAPGPDVIKGSLALEASETGLVFGASFEDGTNIIEWSMWRVSPSGAERIWRDRSQAECPLLSLTPNVLYPADGHDDSPIFGSIPLSHTLANQAFNKRGQLLHCDRATSDPSRWTLELIDGPSGEKRILHEAPLKLWPSGSGPYISGRYYFGRDLTIVGTRSEDDRLELKVLPH
jgi:hypothetical protein